MLQRVVRISFPVKEMLQRGSDKLSGEGNGCRGTLLRLQPIVSRKITSSLTYATESASQLLQPQSKSLLFSNRNLNPFSLFLRFPPRLKMDQAIHQCIRCFEDNGGEPPQFALKSGLESHCSSLHRAAKFKCGGCSNVFWRECDVTEHKMGKRFMKCPATATKK